MHSNKGLCLYYKRFCSLQQGSGHTMLRMMAYLLHEVLVRTPILDREAHLQVLSDRSASCSGACMGLLTSASDALSAAVIILLVPLVFGVLHPSGLLLLRIFLHHSTRSIGVMPTAGTPSNKLGDTFALNRLEYACHTKQAGGTQEAQAKMFNIGLEQGHRGAQFNFAASPKALIHLISK